MPCKEEEDEVNGSTFGGTPKVRISERNTKLVWIFQSGSANHYVMLNLFQYQDDGWHRDGGLRLLLFNF